MSGRSSTEPVVETLVDRELKGALAVQPSPEFLPRVRARIANEPPPQSWRFRWAPRPSRAPMGMVLAAAALVIAVVILSVRRSDPTRAIGTERALLSTKRLSTVSALVTHLESRMRSARVHVPTAGSRLTYQQSVPPAPASRMPNGESSVLISAPEADALWRTIVLAREGGITAFGVDAQLRAEIAIAPIAIEPLATESDAGNGTDEGEQKPRS